MKRITMLIVFIFTIFTVLYGQETSSEIIVQGNTLTRKFEWLLSNAENGKIYVILFNRNETITNSLNFDFDRREFTIIFRGTGAMRSINYTSSSTGSFIQIRSGITLILDNLVTITGITPWAFGREWEALIKIGLGGTLIMNNNTAISGNTSGRGITIDGGNFIMNGGIISGNSGDGHGGGVLIRDEGTFTLNNGTISGNNASNGGGGVCVENGNFIMNNGNISGNVTGMRYSVCVNRNGTFLMTGGSISGNSVEGVGVWGTFTMTGGTISRNINYGVFIEGGTFNINSPATKASINSNICSYDNCESDYHYHQVFLDNYNNNSIFRVNGLRESSY